MNAFNDFLESTTIHGLIYISTSRSTLGKLAWSSFVLAGFGHCRLFDLQLLHGNARIAYFHLHFHPLNLIPCQSCKKSSLYCTTIGTLKVFCFNLHIFAYCSQKVGLGRFVNLSRHNVIFTHHTVNKQYRLRESRELKTLSTH